MAVSKGIVVVVGAGLLAGVAVAGMTTRSIHSGVPDHEGAAGLTLENRDRSGETDGSSWVDRGIAVLTQPAAPFGERAWEASPVDTGPDGSHADYARDDEQSDGYSPGDHELLADSSYDEENVPGDGDYAAPQNAENSQPSRNTPRGADAASQAAARAEAAARDVIAAQGTK